MTKAFHDVTRQYLHAQLNQLKRRDRQKRDFFTKAEQAANKFYGDALTKLSHLRLARESTKILAEDLHAENPDMRRQALDELPADSGDTSGGESA